MSNLPGYDCNDSLIINRAQLLAPSHLQAQCQQQLLNLEGIPQSTGEYLFLRLISVQSPANRLASDLQHTLVEQNGQAVEGDSAQAENAQAVRFRGLGQLLAQLSQDIQSGRQGLWYWQSWQHLFALPTGEALAQLWAEYATDLTDMVQVLTERGELLRLWLSLSTGQAGLILSAVNRSLGIPEASHSLVEMSGTDAVNFELRLPETVLMPWQAIGKKLDKQDPRLQLAVTISLLRWRPDLLFHSQAASRISHITRQLAGGDHERKDGFNYSAVDSKAKQQNVSSPRKSERHNGSDGDSIASTEAELPHNQHQINVKSDAHLLELPRLPAEEKPTANDLQSLKITPSLLMETPTIAPDQMHSVDTERPAPASLGAIQKQNADMLFAEDHRGRVESFNESDAELDLTVDQRCEENSVTSGNLNLYPNQGALYCQQGGIFYLLNFMARKTTQAMLEKYNAYAALNGPWGCLYRLADLLQREDDPALDQFIAYRMGLDSVTKLKEMPALPQAEQYQQAAEKLYGPQVWNPRLLTIPGQVEYTSSHLDIHFSLQMVQVEVRRVGLDINPGWLPWLGQVVNFHYHADITMDGVEN